MKIAICLSGHMRSYDKTFQSLEKHIIGKNDVDIFIYTSQRRGFRNFEHQEETIDEQHVRQIYSPREMIVEPLTNEAVSSDSMFKRIYLVNEMKSKVEEEGSFKYDWVVRARPDLLFTSDIQYDEFERDRIYIPGGFDHGGLNDQFAFGPSELMDKYCSLGKNMESGRNSFETPERELSRHLCEDLKIPLDRFFLHYTICRRIN